MNKKIQQRINLLRKAEKDKAFQKFMQQVGDIFQAQTYTGFEGCIYTAGNGGSHSEADHLTGELLGRYKKNRKPYNSECLSGASSGVISCIANDFGWKHTISRQLQGKTKLVDVFVCFSTSGNSPNIVRALEWCKTSNMISIAFLGKTGGAAKELATLKYIVPSMDTALVQEIHQVMIHMLMERLENES